MSVESAKDFLKRISDDEAFYTKVAACTGKDSRITLIKKNGYSFKSEDIEDLKEEITEEMLHFMHTCAIDI